MDDAHSSTRQDVTGSDENGIVDLIGECFGFSKGGEFLPRRLINPDTIKDLGEFVSVLRLVNVLGAKTLADKIVRNTSEPKTYQRIRSQDVSFTSFLKPEGDVLGQLATDGNHNATGLL